MKEVAKILIVDDEPDILELLEYNLVKENYLVEKAPDGKTALDILENFDADLILMDVMMPEMDGIESCRQIRANKKDKEPYIMFLTARSEEFTEVAAWEAGGDDYIIKPIKPRALLSRIKSVLSKDTRSTTTRTEAISIKDIVVDKSNYTVTTPKKVFSLPKKEFEILYLLAQFPNIIHNRDEILAKVWEEDTYVLSRTVDVHIRKLREKLEGDYIKTIKGVGYMFEK